MGLNFDRRADSLLTGMGVPIPKSKPLPIKANKQVITEQVRPVTESVKRQKLVLITPKTPYEDKAQVTVESLTKLGFISASQDDFIGASDKTFVLDEMTQTGRVTLVYDFSPPGNQGKPALHLYFSANDVPISETLVCFSADSTIGEIKQLRDIMEKMSPVETRDLHSIETVSQLITEAKKSTK